MATKGEKITIEGAVRSSTWKRDKNQNLFCSVTIEAIQVARGGGQVHRRYWIRLDETTKLEANEALGEKLERFSPIGVAGYVSGETVDGGLVFLEDFAIFHPKAERSEIAQFVADHFDIHDTVREYNEQYRAEQKQAREAVATTPSNVLEGTFTVVFDGDENEYETIRFHTPKRGSWAGKTIVSYLMGPINTSDFMGFGTANGQCISTWKRFDPESIARKIAAAKIVLGDEEAKIAAGAAYAMRSGNCARCGKTLTVPASLNRGLGPECAAKGF